MLDICPSCGSANTIHVKARRAVYVYKCRNCGLHFAFNNDNSLNTSGIFNTSQHYYDNIKRHFDIQLAAARTIIPRRVQHYSKILGRPIRSLLEIGCATGAYSQAIAEQGITYLGIEIDQVMFNFGVTNVSQAMRLGNFVDMKIEGQYDVVFASQVLEHNWNPNPLLRKIIEIAAGGLLHLDVPNQNSLSSLVRVVFSGKDYGFIQPPHHMVSYNAYALRHLLHRHGFTPVIIVPLRNDDAVWGQLPRQKSWRRQGFYWASSALGGGSLLTAVARIPD